MNYDFVTIDSKKFVNTTPHAITLQGSDGTLYSVPPCGKIEEIYDSVGKDAIIIGSMLAVQAYPNSVFGMVPVQGFERVPPDQKRMRTDKFSS